MKWQLAGLWRISHRWFIIADSEADYTIVTVRVHVCLSVNRIIQTVVDKISTPCLQKISRMFLLQFQKLLANFHQIWQVAAVINTEQCRLKPTSPGVCTCTTV